MIDSSAVDRVASRIEALASLGGEPDGGVSRLGYSALEREAHELFGSWVTEAGGRVETDAAGNTVGVLSEGTPYLLLGSHLDSVRQGGRYDGTVGVLAGLEAAQRLAQAGPVRVVAFACEEGARFGRPCVGSALAAGVVSAREAGGLKDGDGVSLAEAARQLGLGLEQEPWIVADDVLAFVEVHIEQGRVLESRGTLLGIVDAVAGSARLRLTLTGLAEHSGATPMDLRHDALAAAAELVLAVERLTQGHRELRATVGRLNVSPNGPTTVPGEVECFVDVRDTDPDVQRDAQARVLEQAREICARRGIELTVEPVSEVAPVLLSAWVRRALQRATGEAGVGYRIMPSGAGHDAALVARSAPSAMVFIACEGGRSHVPSERCSHDDIVVAAEMVVRAGKALLADARRGLEPEVAA